MTVKTIYLDNAATTKLDEKVVSAMKPYFSEEYGNPSSQHLLGKKAKEAIEKARKIIADSIGASSEEIIFTSGGTEANNLCLKGLWFEAKKENKNKNHIITTKIEHDSILNVCKWLESQGARITYLDVNSEGFVNPKDVERAINHETLIVSIIQGNNEIGTLQDIEAIGEICRKKGVYFHIDACQSYMKTKINVKKQNLDFVTLNGHKLHGPKGVGALFIRKTINITPINHGGGHEKGIRSGTENVAGIVGFAEAVRLFKENDIKSIRKLRDYAIAKILEIPKAILNGSLDKRLCGNINVSFSDVEGEAIASLVEEKGIMISTGSACASHSLKKSHVLRAIGLNDFEINSSIRVSLSKFNNKQDIDYFIGNLKISIERLRKMSPYA